MHISTDSLYYLQKELESGEVYTIIFCYSHVCQQTMKVSCDEIYTITILPQLHVSANQESITMQSFWFFVLWAPCTIQSSSTSTGVSLNFKSNRSKQVFASACWKYRRQLLWHLVSTWTKGLDNKLYQCIKYMKLHFIPWSCFVKNIDQIVKFNKTSQANSYWKH